MKIIYCPFYSGNYFLNMQEQCVALDIQVLETQGLLSQLALHAGIHQQLDSFPERLTAYHQALLGYDKQNVDNIFHRSILIDSMSIAKTLLRWRDNLSMWGWNCNTSLTDCGRLNALAKIDSLFTDNGWAALLAKLNERVQLMVSGSVKTPSAYQELTIEIPCRQELLPDYIQPLLNNLKSLGVTIAENAYTPEARPETITEIHFSQQWKAEAWLAQQQAQEYHVWINSNNKRLDNWLHAFGKPVGGSEMKDANPQITQMFLLAIQLFQRPLNVNTLLQYLFLPECPLDWQLRRELAKVIVSEGGFCNEKVQECINDYVEREFCTENSETKKSKEQRKKNYTEYLPFDLRDNDSAQALAEESDQLNTPSLSKFLKAISSYAAKRATTISGTKPRDARIAQLTKVAEMTDALLNQIDKLTEGELSFSTLIQWAQSLYEDGDFALYNAQVGSRCIISQPANMISRAENTIWCDFYGDISAALSTDFLSNHELEQLKEHGILYWNKQHESDLANLLMATPIYMTTKKLTVITCEQQGAAKLSTHPLYHQLPFISNQENGDELYEDLATKEIEIINNHREEDNREIQFDAEKHPFSWRETESYSSLEKLLQNPFDYFMRYMLQFTDANATEIKLHTTYGNVAHEVIEHLFTADRGNEALNSFVIRQYEQAFHRALVRKGALLLLPERHLDKERLKYQLRECVDKLADIIQGNGLIVVKCEQKEEHDLGLQGNVVIQGYLDMVLRDKGGNEVVFDLKWATKKDKFKTVMEKNRALQLAIYQAMLMKNSQDHPQAVRTAYFSMPTGTLFSTGEFTGENVEKITIEPAYEADLMEQLRNGYAERRKEIDNGRIETADNMPINEIEYDKAENVYPLESSGARNPTKVENLYSDYKCFTI